MINLQMLKIWPKILVHIFLNLAEDLKLPNPSNKSGVFSVAEYYSHLELTEKFDLIQTEKDYVPIDTSKAAGIDKLPGRFIKDGAYVLAKWVTDVCNFQYL